LEYVPVREEIDFFAQESARNSERCTQERAE